MPTFTIETPDGRKLDIEAADQNSAIAGAQDWVSKNPAATPDVGVDMARGFSWGANTGIDAFLNSIGAVTRVPVNAASRALGYGDVIPELELARRANTQPPETRAGRAMEAVGEVAGASVLPSGALATAGRVAGPGLGHLSQYATAPARAVGQDAVATLGAGSGVAFARDRNLGPTAEAAFGLAGGFAAPNVANLASRTYGGMRRGAQYAQRQLDRARNPETAAYQDIADQAVKADLDLQAVRDQVAPAPSHELRSRNFTPDDMADIVSRRLSGQSPEDIGSLYGLHPATVRKYVRDYQQTNPTPRNLIDIAKEMQGAGGAMPLSNQASADMAIADDPVAAQRLISRQRAQPGRTANIIEQSGVEGRNLEDELTRLATTARAEERSAYQATHANAQPINLRPVIENARRTAFGRKGEVSEKLNEAIDLFYEPLMVPKPVSETQRVRLLELEERVDDLIAREAAPQTIERARRRLDAARYDASAEQVRSLGQPITDLRGYLDARRELDQMITRSMQDGRGTPLTQTLTEFRRNLNETARSANPRLAQADARFSENRSIERILERGAELGRKLTPHTRRALRDFRQMTPTQQELMRVAFERQMADAALGVKRGNAAADQFSSEAFDQIVAALYPRSAGQEIHQRGQTLLRNLRREAISTETTRDVLSGSRTAPLQDDMAELMEGPRAAANLATGRFTKILEDFSNRLARQIGQRAAQERVRILTQTDPAQMLPMLSRLAAEARTAAERAEYQRALREFARVGRRPAAEVGVISSSGESRTR